MPIGEYEEPHLYTKLRGAVEPAVSSSSSVQEGSRDQGVKRRGEYLNEYEYQGEHQTCKREYLQKSLPISEASFQSEDQGSAQRSTRVKKVTSKLSDLGQERKEVPKVLDDQMRPCCSYTGKHLCSSIEDLSEVDITEEFMSGHLFAKVSHPLCMQVG